MFVSATSSLWPLHSLGTALLSSQYLKTSPQWILEMPLDSKLTSQNSPQFLNLMSIFAFPTKNNVTELLFPDLLENSRMWDKSLTVISQINSVLLLLLLCIICLLSLTRVFSIKSVSCTWFSCEVWKSVVFVFFLQYFWGTKVKVIGPFKFSWYYVVTMWFI